MSPDHLPSESAHRPGRWWPSRQEILVANAVRHCWRDALLTYGYDIANYDVEEARTLLLSAAHAEGELTTASAQGLLDDADARDPQYQLGLLDLHLEPVGDGQEQRLVLTSYLQRTEDEPIALMDEPPLGIEPEVLAWAKKVLDVDTDDDPRWMLCWSSLA